MKAGRTTAGTGQSSSWSSVVTTTLTGTGSPAAVIAARKSVALLGGADRVQVGADQLDPVLGQDAVLGQFDGKVERRLATEGGEQRIGLLAADDLGDVQASSSSR